MAEKKEIKKEEKKDTLAELKSKMNSRKFAAWILWSVLIIALTVISFIRDNDTILLKALEYYFYITALYYGGNVLTKKIQADVEARK